MNTARGAMLGPIGIAPLEFIIDDQSFAHNFIVCTKFKQHLIMELDLTQRYGMGIDWDMHGNVFEI